jgi:hypothetical protein
MRRGHRDTPRSSGSESSKMKELPDPFFDLDRGSLRTQVGSHIKEGIANLSHGDCGPRALIKLIQNRGLQTPARKFLSQPRYLV